MFARVRDWLAVERQLLLRIGPAFVTVAGAIALPRIDAVLRAMHPPGSGGYRVNDLSSVFGASASPGTIVATWHDWICSAGGGAVSATAPGHCLAVHLSRPGLPVPGVPSGPAWMVWWYLGIDAVFAAGYTLFLAGLLARVRTRLGDAQPAYARLVGWARLLVPFLFASDIGEDGFQYLTFAHPGTAAWEYVARGLTAAKLLLLVAVLVPLLAGVAHAAWNHPARTKLLDVGSHPRSLRALAVCRVQVALAVVFGLLFFGPGPFQEQTEDAIRRLGDNFWLLAVPLLIVVVSGAILGGTASALITRADDLCKKRPPGSEPDSRGLLLLVVACSAAVEALLAILALSGGWHAPLGLYVAPAIAGLVALLSLPVRDADVLEDNLGELEGSMLPAALAAAPMGIFGAGALDAATGDAIYAHSMRGLALVLVGLGFIAGSLVTYRLYLRLRARLEPALIGLGVLASVAGAALVVGALSWPWSVSTYTNGAIGVFAGFVGVAALIGTGLAFVSERVRPPGALRLLRFRRIPVLGLVLLWFLSASFVDHEGSNAIREAARNGVAGSPARHLYPLGFAFDRWLKQAPVVGTGSSAIRPLVFVGTEGGGVRAAYWTAEVMDCLVYSTTPCNRLLGSRIPGNSIFAASGISGGALGLAEFAARQADRKDAGTAWVRQRIGDDYLGPTFARMLFGDLPNAFLRARSVRDRAAILEGAWERSWPDGPDGALSRPFYARRLRFPLLLFNGTSVVDGCRFETSVLRTALPVALYNGRQLGEACRSTELFDLPSRPGLYTAPAGRRNWILAATKDGAVQLCQDINLSTAALLAARFPYVTPSGRVQCGKRPPSFVVDGGYLEDSGLSPIDELWTALEPLVAAENARAGNPCVVPLLIHIDNQYAGSSAPPPSGRPNELLVPIQGVSSTRAGRDQDARIEAMLLFSRQIAPGQQAVQAGSGRLADRIANVYPRTHPGSEPPLGWVMSATSRTDLARQLLNPNVLDELQKARRWLSAGTLACKR